MTKKVVNLSDYKNQKANKQIKEQIAELDALHDLYTIQEPDLVVRKGYKNFVRLLKALDKKYAKDNT